VVMVKMGCRTGWNSDVHWAGCAEAQRRQVLSAGRAVGERSGESNLPVKPAMGSR